MSNVFALEGLNKCYSRETGELNVKQLAMLAKAAGQAKKFDSDSMLTGRSGFYSMGRVERKRPSVVGVDVPEVITPLIFIKFHDTLGNIAVISPHAATASEREEKRRKIEMEKEAERVKQVSESLWHAYGIYSGLYFEKLLTLLQSRKPEEKAEIAAVKTELFAKFQNKKDDYIAKDEVLPVILRLPKAVQAEASKEINSIFMNAGDHIGIKLGGARVAAFREYMQEQALLIARSINLAWLDKIISEAVHIFSFERVTNKEYDHFFADLSYSDRMAAFRDEYLEQYGKHIKNFVEQVVKEFLQFVAEKVSNVEELDIVFLRTLTRNTSFTGIEWTPSCKLSIPQDSSLADNLRANKITGDIIYNVLNTIFQSIAAAHSPVYAAVDFNAVSVLAKCIANNPDEVNQVNCVGMSPLYLAILKGYADIVQVLMQHEADTTFCIRKSALLYHIKNYQRESIYEAAAKQMENNSDVVTITAVDLANLFNNQNIARILAEHGALKYSSPGSGMRK